MPVHMVPLKPIDLIKNEACKQGPTGCNTGLVQYQEIFSGRIACGGRCQYNINCVTVNY